MSTVITVPTTEQFLEALRASDLLHAAGLPQSTAKPEGAAISPLDWARHLVSIGALTSFQAEYLLSGRHESLLLGQYRILDRLGQGGMSQVYRAEHAVMRRPVAIKVVSSHLLREPGVLTRFQREIQAAARLSHPNIVAAHDAAEQDGVHFLVLEYVDGISLEQLLQANGPLPLSQACDIVRQIADGLQHALDRGVLHCDLKPANIFVSSRRASTSGPADSFASEVKILDWGLAHFVKEGPEAEQLDQELVTGSYAGTPEYMAPELALEGARPTIESDLYSLGCTLYYLLTGQTPFRGSTWSEVILRHQLDQATPVTVLRPDTPDPLARIVHRLLQRDPKCRYPSPRDVRDRLLAQLPSLRLLELTESMAGIAISPGKNATGELCSGRAPKEAASTATPVDAQWETDSFDELDLSAKPAEELSLPPPAPAWPAPESDGQVQPSTAPPRRTRMRPGRWVMALLPVIAAIPVALFLAGWGESPLYGVYSAAIQNFISPDADKAGAPSCPFVVEGLGGRAYEDLREAVAAAKDGDSISIGGRGPHLCGPIEIRGKALTLKGRGPEKPRLVFRHEANQPDWVPFLWVDKGLTLDNLEVRSTADNRHHAAPCTTQFVYAEGAEVRLANCRMHAPQGRALVVARFCPVLELRDCDVVANSTAVSAQFDARSTARLILIKNRFRIGGPDGVCVSLWESEDATRGKLALELDNNQIDTCRFLSLAALRGQVAIVAKENKIRFDGAFLSCVGLEDERAWRSHVSWTELGNEYGSGATWLQVDGRTIVVGGVSAWRSLWPPPTVAALDNSGAVESTPIPRKNLE